LVCFGRVCRQGKVVSSERSCNNRNCDVKVCDGVVLRNLFHPLLVNKFKVDIVDQDARDGPGSVVSEGFTETDSSARRERHEAEGVSPGTLRGQVKGTFVIPAVGQELIRALPLVGVVVEGPDVDEREISCFQTQVTDRLVVEHYHGGSTLRRRVESQSLVEQAVKKLHFLESLDVKGRFNITVRVASELLFLKIRVNDCLLDLLSESRGEGLFLDEVVKNLAHNTCCCLGSCGDEVSHLINNVLLTIAEVVVSEQVGQEIDAILEDRLVLASLPLLHVVEQECSVSRTVLLSQPLFLVECYVVQLARKCAQGVSRFFEADLSDEAGGLSDRDVFDYAVYVLVINLRVMEVFAKANSDDYPRKDLLELVSHVEVGFAVALLCLFLPLLDGLERLLAHGLGHCDQFVFVESV